jgi:hypothetical protein
MRAPMIGGSEHGRWVVVPDPPLDRIRVAEAGPLLCLRDLVRMVEYRLTYWRDGGTISRTEHPVYVHVPMPDHQARPYIEGWLKTGVIAPLGTPTDQP